MFRGNESRASKALRYLLIIQLSEVVPLSILMLFGAVALAATIALFTLLLLAGVTLWTHATYRSRARRDRSPGTFGQYLLSSMPGGAAHRRTMAVVISGATIFLCALIRLAPIASAPAAPPQPSPDVAAIYASAIETAWAHQTQIAPRAALTTMPTRSPEAKVILPTETLAPTNAVAPVQVSSVTGSCDPGDQQPYVYSPDRLVLRQACIHVTGTVAEIRYEADGDVHVLVNLDSQYQNLLTPANANDHGLLVVEAICRSTPTQADAIDPCSHDPDPVRNIPSVGEYVWIEGRYVTDSDHGGWAEIHPLGRWGDVGQPSAAQSIPGSAPLSLATAPATGSRVRTGATCKDGSYSTATGSGACSRHEGVSCWMYSDGTCTNP